MKLKIPPPIIALIFSFLMWWVPTLSSVVSIKSEILFPLFIIIFSIGFLIDISAVVSFRMAKTTVNPMKPETTSQLVSSGIYKLTRNPMYLGVLIMLFAWAVWLGSLFNLAVLVFFVWYITKYQIIPEEEALVVLFSEDFELYKSRVRRWV